MFHGDILQVQTVILCSSSILWAMRGADDYGIIMALMAFLYSFPVGIMLLGFVIYSIIKLKSREKPKNNHLTI